MLVAAETSVDSTDEAALVELDRFIAHSKCRAAPLRFVRAESDDERKALYRLRYEVVMAEGWVAPGALPGGLVYDQDDDNAIQIAGWDRDILIASARLVLPRTNNPLPTEAAFGITIEPRGHVADCGRLLVAPGYRDATHRALWGLLGQVGLELRAAGLSLVCGTFSEKIIALYTSMGFTVRVLGESRSYWGEERYPILVDVLASLPELWKRAR